MTTDISSSFCVILNIFKLVFYTFVLLLFIDRYLQQALALENIVRRNAENTERIMKNAIGYVVSNNALGTVVQSTFDNSTSAGITKLISGVLVPTARSAVRDLDTTNDLTFLRIVTRKFEYLVAPEKEFTIVVMQ
ncbi:dynein light chain roadblock-type 2-like [Rhagoletis pomonella]|uniref:dynein light chain roadblock-type 2-like n=1 Tax=Rhagoletis pomonella TaxID=28610 RepID=UPI0017814D34|nr:dynein light chain roadblock-type 2-like [Rhagoletis pomonella]